jgi:ATP-dependent Clp protease adaptor protein ClpS
MNLFLSVSIIFAILQIIMKKQQLQSSDSTSGLLTSRKELILFNDDVNSFDFVIESLIEVCDHDPVQAEQCALIAHFKGKCGIKYGTLTELTPMNNELNNRGISTVLS